MYRSFTTAVIMIALAATLPADDKSDQAERVKRLKADIADTEKKLTRLRKELDRANEPLEYKKASGKLFASSSVEVGTEGTIAGPYTHVVYEVIDEDTVVLRVSEANFAPHVAVRGVSTKGMEKGTKLTSEGTWRVVAARGGTGGTMPGRASYAIRPCDGAKLTTVK